MDSATSEQVLNYETGLDHPDDNSTITVCSLPSKHQHQPPTQNTSHDDARKRQHSQKRALIADDTSHQPFSKRPRVPQFYLLAARVTRGNAKKAADDAEVEDKPPAPAKKTAAAKPKKPKPSRKTKTKAPVMAEDPPSEEDAQGNDELENGGSVEQPVAADKGQDRALQEAIWDCSRMESNFDDGVTMDDEFVSIDSQSYQNLEEATVFSAIASVWRGVIPYARCSLQNHSFYREAQKGKTKTPIQPPSNTLIMPLLWNTPTFRDGKMYNIFEQWVLVVATHDGHETEIHLDIFFHRPGTKGVLKAKRIEDLKDQQIREAARSIVCNSGWLSKAPTFDEKGETWHPVCESIGIKPNDRGSRTNTEGTWSSAHLVVLTAWAYMLGLPIPYQMKPGLKQKEKLCPGIQRLVTMAFDGRLTPEVIRLFIKMNFSTTQELKGPGGAPRMKLSQDQLIDDVGAYMMNAEILDRVLASLQKSPNAYTGPPDHGPRKKGGEQPSTAPAPHPLTLQANVNPSHPYRNRDKAYWQTTYLAWMRARAQPIRACIRQHRGEDLWAHLDAELDEDQVFGAIGALWYGRWMSSKRRRLGFGSMYAVQWLRQTGNNTGDYRMVGGSERTAPAPRDGDDINNINDGGHIVLPLMIPLCGTLTDDFAIGHGHWVFVLARLVRRREDGSRHVQLHLWNSAPNAAQHAAIQKQARSVVWQSGILGRGADGKHRYVQVKWDPMEVMPCPAQRVLNSCGVYVVLNAWAYQLGLTSPPRRLFSTSEEQDRTFVRYAVLMINLALHGEVDSHGIRAFLLATGYCHPRELRARQRGGDEGVACIEVGDACLVLLSFIDAVIQEEKSEAEKQYAANQRANQRRRSSGSRKSRKG